MTNPATIAPELSMQTNPNGRTAMTSPTPADTLPRIDSHVLLHGQRTVEIEHGKERYTLRVTKDNKLILTK